MSLLEDIFLQDEAGEAEELERVIEGDDDEQIRPSDNSDDNSEKEDEAEEDKIRVDPTKVKEKRVSKNPRFILNPARLTGPRGIQIIPEHFKDFKFKGKGHEKEDLDVVLKKLEHWAYRLYPKFGFEDCLKKIETLGKKRPVMVHLHKIRTDQFMSEETVIQNDSSDDETPVPQEDEFDKLLQQQIDLARATPAPGSVRKGFRSPGDHRSPLTMPKASSSPSISNEQRERMLKNRQMAEERRLAKLKQIQTEITLSSVNTEDTNEVSKPDSEEIKAKRYNRSVIDSSDEECDVTSVNQSVSVDVHVPSTRKPQDSEVDNQDSEVDNHYSELDNQDNKVSISDNKLEKTSDNSVIDTVEISNLDTNNELDIINSEKDTLSNTKNLYNESTDIILDITEETGKNNNSVSLEHDENSNNDISQNIVTNKDKTDPVTVENKSIEDEIMDVDFSDDF